MPLPDSERQPLRQLPKQRRDGEGYGKGTVVLRLDKGRAAASIAKDLGLEESTVYPYAHAFRQVGREKYLAPERPGYWGLLPSAPLAGLCQQRRTRLYTDCRASQAWLVQPYGVSYAISGLTDLRHRPPAGL